MRRFFITPPGEAVSAVTVDREESRHLTRVLRLQVGDRIEMIDGIGGLYVGTVESLGPNVLVGDLRKIRQSADTGSPLLVCQGDLKGRKMDAVVQKCTELGVQRLLPFTSTRSQGRIDLRRRERRQERWENLVKSACKQCGRLTLLELDEERSFADLLGADVLPDPALKILFWEEEGTFRLSDIDWARAATQPTCLMLGPEGGLSKDEVEQARRQGWRVATLGQQVLRAETATLAAVAIVQHLRGVM